MGYRMKRIATWLLTLLLVANVVAGCGGGLDGQGRQDRFGGPQPAASLLDETQGEQKEQPLGAVQEAEPGLLQGERLDQILVEEGGSYTSKEEVAPGMSIGGSRFGDREGLLPDKEGRQYYECDIGYESGRRGAARLVYSDDGLVFYTGDHYKTFERSY